MAQNTYNQSQDLNIPKLILTFAAGINENQTPDINEASSGYNFELGARQTKFIPRACYDIEGVTPNVGKITGILQLVKRDLTKTSLVCSGDTIYQWFGGSNTALNGTTSNGTKIITGLSSTTSLRVGQLATGTGIGAAPNPIATIDSPTQVTLTVNSTASATVAITFTSFVSKGTVIVDALLRDTYWSLGEYLVISDVGLKNVVKKWDGATFGDMPTGLGGTSFYAKYSVVHLNRVWYFNVTAGSATPHLIVASTFENPAIINITNRGGPADVGGGTFSTGLEPFYLVTPDLKPINGVSVFQNILIISTVDGKLYKLIGTDSKTFTFVDFYVGSAAIGNESIQNIGNDVVYIRKGGNINMLSSVQSFGDVKSNDVSRWIPNTVKNINDSLIVYDQSNQKVYFFIANKVLVLFKDILFGGNTDQAVNSGLSPWSIYTTLHANQFNTKAAKYMQHPDSTDYSVYWGDTNGNVYDINGVGLYGDAGVYEIDCKRVSRLIDVEILKPFPYNESNLLGKLQFRRKAADCQMTIAFQWSDEFNTSYSLVTLKGPSIASLNGSYWNRANYWGGGSYWNNGNTLTNAISHQTFSPTGKGAGFYITMQATTKSAYQVDHLELF